MGSSKRLMPVTLAVAALIGTTLAPAAATTSTTPARHPVSRRCPPAAIAAGYSDALNDTAVSGVKVGGLSSLAHDRRSHSYVASVDHQDHQPARLHFFRNLAHPRLLGHPLVLKHSDGTPYTATTADNEGLAVLPDGDFAVSSEIKPSIRIFSRSGRQRGTLQIPSRFRVAPKGQAHENWTLEGLSAGPRGRELVASMEGPLTSDEPADGSPATARRMLIYRHHRGGYWHRRGAYRHHHDRYRLAKQIGYRVDRGPRDKYSGDPDAMRIPAVSAYAPGKLLVLETAYVPNRGNIIRLYAVTGLDHARDVSRVQNLSKHPRLIVGKRLVANVTRCPDLGATSKEAQINPLMANYEGMTTHRLGNRHRYVVSLISDNNFSSTQTTRLLNLVVRLP